MKEPMDLLPDDIVWAEGGHASDVVLTALADGQTEIVPPRALAHVETCPACTRHLGNAALLSIHTGRELATLSAEASPASMRVPYLAIVLGLVVAVLGLAPSLLDGGADARHFVTREVPLLVSGLSTLAHRLLEPGSTSSLVITYGAAAMLALMGLAVVRMLPKKETSR